MAGTKSARDLKRRDQVLGRYPLCDVYCWRQDTSAHDPLISLLWWHHCSHPPTLDKGTCLAVGWRQDWGKIEADAGRIFEQSHAYVRSCWGDTPARCQVEEVYSSQPLKPTEKTLVAWRLVGRELKNDLVDPWTLT